MLEGCDHDQHHGDEHDDFQHDEHEHDHDHDPDEHHDHRSDDHDPDEHDDHGSDDHDGAYRDNVHSARYALDGTHDDGCTTIGTEGPCGPCRCHRLNPISDGSHLTVSLNDDDCRDRDRDLLVSQIAVDLPYHESIAFLWPDGFCLVATPGADAETLAADLVAGRAEFLAAA